MKITPEMASAIQAAVHAAQNAKTSEMRVRPVAMIKWWLFLAGAIYTANLLL